MTSVDELQQCPCERLDPLSIDAYVKHYLDPLNNTRLVLESPWGESDVDLTPAIKAGETITHLFLTPVGNPAALQYNREDYLREGAENDGADCIEGDDLSRIISMRYLKDVSQDTPPRGGDVYMYDEVTNVFRTFNLQAFVDKTESRLDKLEGDVADLQRGLADVNAKIDMTGSRIDTTQQIVNKFINDVEARLVAIENRLTNIESVIAKPSWAPSSASLVWGTINNTYAADVNNKGLYSHNPSSNVVGDERFQ